MAALFLIPALLIAVLLVYIFTGGPRLPRETDEIIAGVMSKDLPEQVVGQTGYADAGGVRIWYETIQPVGTPKGIVLLLMGLAGDALSWPPGFVRAFVATGYQVIRFDYRGTGLSDWLEQWDRKHPYTLSDLANDAVAVLDAAAAPKVHLVGLSLGGMVAQEIAIRHSARVESLTLMMTSGYIGDPDVPGLTSAYFFRSLVAGLPLFRYRILGGEKNLIKERLAKLALVTGIGPGDIQEAAERVLYDLRQRRGINLRAALQHQAAVTISGSRYAGLARLQLPALVIHGTDDPIFPLPHGQKLAQTIPGARSLWLEGVGHVFPLPGMDAVMQKILAFLDE